MLFLHLQSKRKILDRTIFRKIQLNNPFDPFLWCINLNSTNELNTLADSLFIAVMFVCIIIIIWSRPTFFLNRIG